MCFIAWSNFSNPGEYILNTKSNGLYWYWSTTLAINLFTFCGHPNCLCMLEGIIEFYYATFWNIALFAKHNWLYICSNIQNIFDNRYVYNWQIVADNVWTKTKMHHILFKLLARGITIIDSILTHFSWLISLWGA